MLQSEVKYTHEWICLQIQKEKYINISVYWRNKKKMMLKVSLSLINLTAWFTRLKWQWQFSDAVKLDEGTLVLMLVCQWTGWKVRFLAYEVLEC